MKKKHDRKAVVAGGGKADEGEASQVRVVSKPVKRKTCAGKVVEFWVGVVDPRKFNRLVLKLIRHHDKKRTEAEVSRQTGIDRQHVHNLHCSDMDVTLPMLVRWCNGREIDAGYLVATALVILRMSRSSAAGTNAAGGAGYVPAL